MLTKKPLAALLLLAGAAGGPYVLYETDAGRQAQSTAEQFLGVKSSATGDLDSLTQPSSWGTSAENLANPRSMVDSEWMNGLPAAATTKGLVGDYRADSEWMNNGLPAKNRTTPEPGQLAGFQPSTSRSLRDVLRFDITPQWVTQQYSRVTTVLADLNLDGMRMPLVTGTQVHDLAGTLTYYFDRYQRLQRITIHGATGEPNRFVHDLLELYQWQQEPSLGGGLYMIKWNGQPTSILHIAPASVIQAQENYARYTVFLELNLPSMPYGLSAEAASFVEAGKATKRW